jgi:hypothetical protein
MIWRPGQVNDLALEGPVILYASELKVTVFCGVAALGSVGGIFL